MHAQVSPATSDVVVASDAAASLGSCVSPRQTLPRRPRRPSSPHTTRHACLSVAVFDRLESFLPTLRAANERLEQADPESLDIENVDEASEHIEMNLACGIFEAQPGSSEGGPSAASRSPPAEERAAEIGDSGSLRLPTRRTAAVEAASQAGRPLVTMVDGGESGGGDDGDGGGGRKKKRKARVDG